jgi:hypothetical protein
LLLADSRKEKNQLTGGGFLGATAGNDPGTSCSSGIGYGVNVTGSIGMVVLVTILTDVLGAEVASELSGASVTEGSAEVGSTDEVGSTTDTDADSETTEDTTLLLSTTSVDVAEGVTENGSLGCWFWAWTFATERTRRNSSKNLKRVPVGRAIFDLKTNQFTDYFQM